MNNTQATELNQETNLIVTEEMRSYFYDIARWSSFLAIVGFIFSGITIIGAFTIGAAMDSNPQLAEMLGKFGALGKVLFTAINLVVAFAIFYPSLLLFKYAAKAKYGVLYGEQGSLNEAFSKLKSLFKYWGIMTITFIALYAFLILSSIMAGLAAR
jgi:hypothetical protein